MANPLNLSLKLSTIKALDALELKRNSGGRTRAIRDLIAEGYVSSAGIAALPMRLPPGFRPGQPMTPDDQRNRVVSVAAPVDLERLDRLALAAMLHLREPKPNRSRTVAALIHSAYIRDCL